MKVLMVCLGNICRSPLAEGILKHKLQEAGLHHWEVDSAGTGGWHAGEKPDSRSIRVARRYGIDISEQRARKIERSDFKQYDLILAMDRNNLEDLRHAAGQDSQVPIRLLMDYVDNPKTRDVPDPYHGGEEHFEQVFQLLNDACEQLLAVHPD
jgi:protein-tyrosine phosphatase